MWFLCSPECLSILFSELLATSALYCGGQQGQYLLSNQLMNTISPHRECLFAVAALLYSLSF
jgi:hypothetical protein